MTFQGIDFQTPHQAIEHAVASGGCAIRLNSKNLAVTPQEADRLIGGGVSFAYLADRNGNILTIPVNG